MKEVHVITMNTAMLLTFCHYYYYYYYKAMGRALKVQIFQVICCASW
jgi:hypothetical protein